MRLGRTTMTPGTVRRVLVEHPVLVAGTLCTLIACSVAIINIHSAIPDTNAILDLSPLTFIRQTLTPWSNNQLGQASPGSAVAYLPMALIYAALEAVHVPLAVVQITWITALIALAGIGMALLYELWSERNNTSEVVASSLLYALSPYVWVNLKGATSLLIPYALTPLIAVLAIQAARKPTRRNVISLLGVTCYTGMAVNPPELIIAAVIVVALVFPELVHSSETRGACWIIRWYFGIGVVMAAMSAWWVGPFIAAIHSGGTAGYFTTDPLSVQAASSSFREVLRLTGLWALYSGFNGVPYYPDAGYLNSAPVIVVTMFAPALFALSFSRLRNFERLRTIVLGLLVIVAVPLAVSIYPPNHPGLTGAVYAWLSAHVYVFRAFRSNYKWVAVIAICYALGIPRCIEPTARVVAERRPELASSVRNGAVLGIAALLVAYSVPGAAGLLFPRSYKLGEVPQYWKAAGHWLTAQSAPGRVLFLPFVGFPKYTWGAPYGPFASIVTARPSLMSQPGLEEPSGADAWLGLLAKAGTGLDVPLAHIAGILGVRYIVDEGDIAWREIGSPSPAAMAAYLEGQSGLREVATFGKLSIYEVAGPIVPVLGEAHSELTVSSDLGMLGVAGDSPASSLVRPRTVDITNSVVARASASSVYPGSDTNAYGPQQVLKGTGAGVAWVSGVPGGVGQWIRLTFKHLFSVPHVTVVSREDGIDALPTLLSIEVGHRSKVVGVSNGVATASFPGSTVHSVKITIDRVGPGGPNVGIAAVVIPGVPLDRVMYPAVTRQTPYIYGVSPGHAGVGTMAHVIPAKEGSLAKLTGTLSTDPAESDATLVKYLEPVGVAAVTSSSRWEDLAAYSSLWTLSGNPTMAWVPNNPDGIGAWVQYRFATRRFIGSIGVEPRNDGVDRVVSAIRISVGGKSLGVYRLAANGLTRVPINRTGSVLRLTIVSVGRDSGKVGKDRGNNVGLERVVIPGVSVRRHPNVLAGAEVVENGATRVIGSSSGLGGRERWRYLDRLAVGEQVLRVEASVFHLRKGNNTLTFKSNGLLATASLEVSGGVAEEAFLHAVAFVRRSPVEMVATVGHGGLLSLNQNTNGEWSLIATGEHREVAHERVGILGAIWELRAGQGAVVIRDHGAVRVVEWLELQGALMIVIFSIAEAVRMYRRRGSSRDRCAR